MPSNSDLIKWAEQGRLHTKYTKVGSAGAAGDSAVTFQVNDTGVPAFTATNGVSLRVGQTIMIVSNGAAGSNKAIITSVNLAANQFDAAIYETGSLALAGTGLGNSDTTVFLYGSEFKKGTN